MKGFGDLSKGFRLHKYDSMYISNCSLFVDRVAEKIDMYIYTQKSYVIRLKHSFMEIKVQAQYTYIQLGESINISELWKLWKRLLINIEI